MTKSEAHISPTQTHARRLARGICPDCNKYTYFAIFHQEWYGWDRTCLRCGRKWSGRERIPFSSPRTARRDSVRAARDRWKRGTQKGEKNEL